MGANKPEDDLEILSKLSRSDMVPSKSRSLQTQLENKAKHYILRDAMDQLGWWMDGLEDGCCWLVGGCLELKKCVTMMNMLVHGYGWMHGV